jgi:putative flippase GtrA
MTFAEIVLPAVRWTFMPVTVANFFGVAVPAFSSYFGHKFWTYR